LQPLGPLVKCTQLPRKEVGLVGVPWSFALSHDW
jgi:hypothetical protein